MKIEKSYQVSQEGLLLTAERDGLERELFFPENGGLWDVTFQTPIQSMGTCDIKITTIKGVKSWAKKHAWK